VVRGLVNYRLGSGWVIVHIITPLYADVVIHPKKSNTGKALNWVLSDPRVMRRERLPIGWKLVERFLIMYFQRGTTHPERD